MMDMEVNLEREAMMSLSHVIDLMSEARPRQRIMLIRSIQLPYDQIMSLGQSVVK